MKVRVDGATFRSEARLLAAARTCRAQGFDIVDVRSPYPVHGIDEPAGIRRTRLPAVTLGAGVAGFAVATWFQQWSTATDWPVNVGGKPWDSGPAFLPVTFEVTVLFAGLATVAALLVRCRLRPGARPAIDVPGVTDDRFALFVAAPPAARAPTDMAGFWERLGAERSFTAEVAR